jgi:hypothetical protein
MRGHSGLRTPIADMVAQMLAVGSPAEAIVSAVAVAESMRQRTGSSPVNRGERLSPDWQPSMDCVTFASARGLPAGKIDSEAEKFRNYWIAKSGQGATKLDWEATWRNWIISTVERANGTAAKQLSRSHPTARPAPTGADAVLAGMGRLARRIDQRRDATRPSHGQIPDRANAPLQLDLERGRTR